MKQKISYGILLCCMCLGLFYTFYQWEELKQFSNQAGLRYEEGVLSPEQIKVYYKENLESTSELTIWDMEKEQNITWKETGKQTKGTIIKVYGNMAEVLPFPMKHGSFSFFGDTSGCVISSGLAFQLFGAEDVVGNVVFYDGKEWRIRGVLKLKESVLGVYHQKNQEAMSYVQIWNPEQPPAPQLEQIKSGLGLGKESYAFAGSFYCSIARIMISLPFWLGYFYLYKIFKSRSSNRIRRIGKIFFLVGIVMGIGCSISFTSDFVPAQWSDFGFWKEKGKEIITGIRNRNQFPEVYWEQQILKDVKGIAAGTVAMLVGVFGIHYKNKKNVEKNYRV